MKFEELRVAWKREQRVTIEAENYHAWREGVMTAISQQEQYDQRPSFLEQMIALPLSASFAAVALLLSAHFVGVFGEPSLGYEEVLSFYLNNMFFPVS